MITQVLEVPSVEKRGNLQDLAYQGFIYHIQQRLIENIHRYGPLFTTNNTEIWEIYLSAFNDSHRQYHNCSACKEFIRKYGSLAVIDEDGLLFPAMWASVDAPEGEEKEAVYRMAMSFQKSKVTGVFLSNDKVWGSPVTGIWRHFAISPPEDSLYKGIVKTSEQAMAEKKEDFKNIIRALQEFNLEIVDKALSLLKLDVLYRGEKVIGPVQWLHDLIFGISDKKGQQRTNLIWKAVALAPAGFCHPRSSMAGTFLEDLSSGMDFEQASRRFKDKMHPLQYQRPQVSPNSGNIKRAEEIVEKLGIKESLRRRFARLDEIKIIWWWPEREILPKPTMQGVFSHLKPKDKSVLGTMEIPVSTMSWEKFRKNVLSDCLSIKYRVPVRGSFVALVTASVDASPPIFQWDSPENRNPFSLYVYHNGSNASQWGLSAGSWVSVNAITSRPNEWQSGFDHQHKGIIFILDGAVDSKNSSLAIFPETLKSELHEIRSTIEAFSRAGKLEGQDQASACGVMLADKSSGVLLQVKLKGGITAQYQIDRLD